MGHSQGQDKALHYIQMVLRGIIWNYFHQLHMQEQGHTELDIACFVIHETTLTEISGGSPHPEYK